MSPAAASVPTLPPPPAVIRTGSAAPAGWAPYTVRSGDTLFDLAARTGTSTTALIQRNQLRDGGHLIRIGSTLLVPGRGAASATAASTTPAPASAAPRVAVAPAQPAAGFTTYTVRLGDTVTGIAMRMPATAQQILAANGLGARTLLRIGQVLRIPGTAAAAVTAPPRAAAPRAAAAVPAPATTTSSYRVVSGDTIEAIARKTGASRSALISANGLRAPYLIQVGQVLTISKPVATAANTFAGRTYPAATVTAAAQARAAIAATGKPTRQEMRAIIAATAARYGVDQRLALAIGYQESGWDQGQVSVANAIGAMQVIPSSGQWASDLAGRRLNLLDARDNATAGVVILRALTRSSSSLDVAIAGYYQGLGSVQKKGMYADTKGYVASVKALMSRV